MKRNGTIDVIKFISSIALALGHWGKAPNSYLVVEFLFIVSGYLMCRSAERDDGPIFHDCRLFILRKWKRVLPEFIITWIIAIFFIYIRYMDFEKGVRFLTKSATWELSFATMFGVHTFDFVMGVTWYISAMLICMAVVYPMIRYKKEAFLELVAPFMFLALVGFMYHNVGSLYIVYSDGRGTYFALARALLDILAGCLTYRMVGSLGRYKFSLAGKWVMTAVEWIAWVCVYYTIKLWGMSDYDFVIVVLMVFACSITFSDLTYTSLVFNRGLFYWLGNLSYSIFLCHVYIREIVNKYIDIGVGKRMMVIMLATSVLIMYLAKAGVMISVFLKKRIKKVMLEGE